MKCTILNTLGSTLTPEARAILAQVGTIVDISAEDILQSSAQARVEIIVAGLGVHFNRHFLEQAPKLRLIATATTGLDHIDLEYARQRGIKILSLRGEEKFLNTITSTAELACALMLNLVRGVSAAAETVKQYQWNRNQFRGHSVVGKTLGIVGFGRLGRMMARYGAGLGMKVVAHDPFVAQKIFQKHKVSSASFKNLLKLSDIISIHVHLDSTTENMFNGAVFKQMKPTSYLINTARGKIINEKDILAALKRKIIAGYATDVLADEISFGKVFGPHPLVEYAQEHNNILIVPHIGGMTFESRAATDIFIARKVVAWARKHL